VCLFTTKTPTCKDCVHTNECYYWIYSKKFFVTRFNDIYSPYNIVINVYDLLRDVGSVHIANIDDTIHGNMTYNGYINNH